MQSEGKAITIKVLTRKLVHACGSLILLVYWFLGLNITQFIIVALIAAYLTSEYLRLRGSSLPFFTWMTRSGSYTEEQQGIVATPIWFALGVFSTITLFPFDLALIGVLTLTIGDPVASLVGLSTRWNHPIPFNRRKSVEGTLSGIIASWIVCSIFTDPITALIGGTAGMITEALPIDLNDNVTIPIAACTIIYILKRVT